ncbi:DNA-binding protein YbaB [Catenuloplanes nepalensis]|uniref:DNA-binding protein YbaB n=1 Tax=Catenuloplanes nepalensis TaxID=587533 RepID=A0ABT9MRB8_9ACTN|nr:YbaB/EbfC family nucleoid-associated protein [Catenuloplanes nepalensis]MDP9793976.1 DNA-binding protein YbaB [Catenuloplanes nepalensis]
MRAFENQEEVLALIERVREQNQRDMARVEAYLAEADGLTGEGFSEDGSVRAEVDEDGLVSRLDIPDSALRRGSHLSEMIMVAIREAQADRALKVAELGQGINGAQTAERVRDVIPEHIRDRIAERRRGDGRG